MGRPKGSKNKATITKTPVTRAKAETPEPIVEEPNTAFVPEQEEATVIAPQVDDDDEVGDGTEDYEKLGEPAPQKELTQADVNLMLAQTMKQLVDNQPIKKVPWARFKTKSSFNATGKRRRILERRCYQNGKRMFIPNLFDEEISLLNQVKPGKYIKGMVTIVEQQNGSNTDLHIIYANATETQRFANMQEWRSLTELLKRCVTEGPTIAETRRRRSA